MCKRCVRRGIALIEVLVVISGKSAADDGQRRPDGAAQWRG